MPGFQTGHSFGLPFRLSLVLLSEDAWIILGVVSLLENVPLYRDPEIGAL
jgi:hypothetical protein